jgi:hypothetical protein
MPSVFHLDSVLLTAAAIWSKRSGPNSPHSIGFTNVLFDLFGPRLALGHASRAEALLPLEPYGRGKDLSLTADHYLHRAFDAEEEAILLCFCRPWSSRANGTRLIFGAGSVRCEAASAAHLHRPAKPIFMEDVLYSRRREPRLLAD